MLPQIRGVFEITSLHFVHTPSDIHTFAPVSIIICQEKFSTFNSRGNNVMGAVELICIATQIPSSRQVELHIVIVLSCV